MNLTVIIVLLGFVVFIIGSKIHPAGVGGAVKPKPGKQMFMYNLSQFIAFLGLFVFVAGIYAGLRGPLKWRSYTIPRFVFTKQRTGSPAFMYALKNLEINGGPGGLTEKYATYVVDNKGGKPIRALVFEYKTKRGPVELKVEGPFYPGKRKSVHVPVAGGTKRLKAGVTPQHDLVNAFF